MTEPHLFSPLTLRGLTVKNRIVLSPMQQFSATPDGKVGQWHLVHLGSRAVGGAGLIITESLAVSKVGRSTHHDAGLWHNDHVDGWKTINHFIHEQGAKTAAQLSHFGSKGSRSHPDKGLQYLAPADGGWVTKSASAVAPFSNMSPPEALTIDEIKQIIQDFVTATQRAIAADFDAIELHAGHGYLFHQFYSRIVNHRDDMYGGSFENRIRFLLETVAAVREVMPVDMPLLVRISAVDFLDDDKAWQIEDSIILSQLLKQYGVDLITASAGGFVFLDKAKVYPSYQVPYAAKIKAEVAIPTGAVGLITEPVQANGIITSGQADVVVIAREFLRDPYFPIHAARVLEHDVHIPFQYRRAF